MQYFMNFTYLAPKIIEMKLALFGRKTDLSSLKSLNILINKLKECENVELCCYSPFYDYIKDAFSKDDVLQTFDSYKNLPQDTDIFLSLGGDGTFLESLTFIRGSGIPVAGINFGRLGFLTTAKVGGDNEWIEKLITGNYLTEERTLLSIKTETSEAMPKNFYHYALNEITLQRRNPAMLEISISVDGKNLPTYIADGVLIGSATGSTAYSLSIGGPIVTPDSKVLIIAPIAPHNLNVRPIIVPETSVVAISYESRGEEALLTADNRYFVLPKGEKIVISKGEYALKCVSINSCFIEALSQKLLWGEDKRTMLK